jgi:predicted nucleotidyltransferase
VQIERKTKFIALFFVVSKIMPIFAMLMITNMTKDECITLLKKYMSILKDKYGITSLSLFGSTARGEQKEGSDIDLFVDTETPNPFLLMDAKEFLEEATGSSVDIVRNHQNLNPRLRKRILKDGIFIF